MWRWSFLKNCFSAYKVFYFTDVWLISPLFLNVCLFLVSHYYDLGCTEDYFITLTVQALSSYLFRIKSEVKLLDQDTFGKINQFILFSLVNTLTEIYF